MANRDLLAEYVAFREKGDMANAVAVLPASLPEDRRRTAHSHDWRDGLTPDTLEYANWSASRRLDAFELTPSCVAR